ncbi:class I tRNA ligase family protein, partial [Patescibacteria group bacterium]|nr:class I tRNA ligase family protein [Patescibacteria group bacterium]
KGKELVGLKYEPLFEKSVVEHKEKSKNIYQTLSADFVNTQEGTGLVHIAPAFGQDDMELIKKQKNDFPILVTVDEEGKFKSEVKKWKGKFVKKADPLIIEHLNSKGKLFAEEQYEHDYPFCWRCDTPLLYYPKESWFIKTTALKDQLIKNNQKINWIPGHIKDGRFGEWLNELKDWALSRERYWGTPLPIWQCDNCENQIVIGSRDDLKKQEFSTNKYFLLRHGEAKSNVEEFFSGYPELKENPLSKKGKLQVEKSTQELKSKKIDIIISSDIQRAKKTSEIIGKELGIKPLFDQRLREVDFGDFNGKLVKEKDKLFNPHNNLAQEDLIKLRFEKPFPNGENWADIRLRMLGFVKDIDRKYKNKNILIVSHQLPLSLLHSTMNGQTILELNKEKDAIKLKTGEFKEIVFNLFPYNEKGELDFHRPFIDEISFKCPKCKKQMNRVKEVIDCWFDSGSMPFSQTHWPFNNKLSVINNVSKPPALFPADYISEAIDQTRGWFYTLLAISTLLGFGPSYKNVICLGLVLDDKGQKMSKSKGNMVDPWKIIDVYGADALRWYFYTVNQPGASKLFSENDLDKSVKKFLMCFWNCYKFLDLYKDKINKTEPVEVQIENILDKWIVSKLNGLIGSVSKELDKNNITVGARMIEDFVINDLSLWYIRRSRKRFQDPKTDKEFNQAFSVLRFILLEVSKILSPFVPFIAEEVYQNLSDKEIKSVHLTDWPKTDKKMVNNGLEAQMEALRKIVGMGLNLRNNASIKVRQPLVKLEIEKGKLRINEELLNLAKDELNVKQVVFVDKIQEKDMEIIEDKDLKIAIDIKITPELKQEGMIREISRQIQQMRKDAIYKPKDKIVVYAKGEGDLNNFLNNHKKELIKQAKAEDLILNHKEKFVFDVEKETKVDGLKLWLGLKLIVK